MDDEDFSDDILTGTTKETVNERCNRKKRTKKPLLPRVMRLVNNRFDNERRAHPPMFFILSAMLGHNRRLNGLHCYNPKAHYWSTSPHMVAA